VRRVEPDYIVDWKNQDAIRRQLLTTSKPTDEWGWVTQEDLWIYEALLTIVAKTNRDASGPHNAVISTITSLEVGQAAAGEAAARSNRISSSGDSSAEDEGAGGGESPTAQ